MIRTIGLSGDMADYVTDLILEKSGKNPLDIARIQVILPTKRACRSVKEAFLKRSQNIPLLLPKLSSLYELDDLSEEIPSAISPLERTLLLARLCALKPNILTPDQAIKVSVSLGDLLDEFYQFETDLTKLHELVQNPIFAEHWNETLVFLDILTKEWPKILRERGLIDEADRRIRLIDAYTRKLVTTTDIVIAAGLDGGLPAVRRLLSVINKLPNGLILTEGIDVSLSEEEWQEIPAHHWQSGFQQILAATNERSESIESVTPQTTRERLIIEALKPEDKTDTWRTNRFEPSVLDGITRIDCDTLAEEALTIALMLREALETPGQTAALVTPDRQLARRVITEMQRWGVVLDDSAGLPIPQTELGIFLRLLVDAAKHPEKASALLALLKHPLAADGKNPISFRQQIREWEKTARLERKQFNPEIQTNFKHLANLLRTNVLTPFKSILSAHIQAAEDLAKSHDKSGSERLWGDGAGQTVFQFLSDLMQQADLVGDIEPIYYPTLMDLLLNTITVRPKYGMNQRLDILGPIEARFHHYDICIIGGLNEGIFPGLPKMGPWLNRQMRQFLQLPSPEQKTASLSADFAHCFCSPKVILTRSKKTEGTETIPSRFLSRLDAVLAGNHIPFVPRNADWAKDLEKPMRYETIISPAPCPPVEARPTSLAVTKVELLMRNPYAVYARYILKLFPLDPLENNQIQQLYGMAVHQALDKFIRENALNTNRPRLLQLVEESMTDVGMKPVDRLFYIHRFKQAADFIIQEQIQTSQNWRTGRQIQKSLTEQSGSWTFDVDGKSFTLKGTVDRIDFIKESKNKYVRILDYKTGTVPSQKEMEAGFAPQLPLEALLFLKRGFDGVEPIPKIHLEYWKLAAKAKDCKVIRVNLNTDLYFDKLKSLIKAYRDPQMVYRPPVTTDHEEYNDYKYLSRCDEWAYGDDE